MSPEPVESEKLVTGPAIVASVVLTAALVASVVHPGLWTLPHAYAGIDATLRNVSTLAVALLPLAIFAAAARPQKRFPTALAAIGSAWPLVVLAWAVTGGPVDRLAGVLTATAVVGLSAAGLGRVATGRPRLTAALGGILLFVFFGAPLTGYLLYDSFGLSPDPLLAISPCTAMVRLTDATARVPMTPLALHGAAWCVAGLMGAAVGPSRADSKRGDR